MPTKRMIEINSSMTTIGSSDECDIMLEGLGISENHAIFTYDSDKKIFKVKPLEPNVGKLVVWGEQIFKEKELQERDRVVFGYGNAFQVYMTTPSAGALANCEDYTKVIHDRVASNTPQTKNIDEFITVTHNRIGHEKTQNYMREVKVALDQIAEANEYSKAKFFEYPFDRNNVYFSLETMIDIKEYETDEPEVAIRCRNKRTNEVLFLWRYVKFVKRLEMMREWYRKYLDGEVTKLSEDPWSDILPSEVRSKKEEQKQNLAENIRRVKQQLDTLESEHDQIYEKGRSIMSQIEEKLDEGEKKNLNIYIDYVAGKHKVIIC